MSTRRRMVWLIGIGVSQACLTLLAVYCIQHTTETKTGLVVTGGSLRDRGCQHFYRGGPVVWSESTRGMESGLRLEKEFGPLHHRGANPLVPTLMVALAMGLPFAVAGCTARRRTGVDAERPRASRACRSARVAVLAAIAGLLTAAVDAETSYLEPRPVTFIDRLIDYFRPDVVVGTGFDGTPVTGRPEPLIAGSEWYNQVHSLAVRVRDRVESKSPTSPYVVKESPGLDVPLPEYDMGWRFRTRIVLAATGLGLLIGCLLFRPWRRAGVPSASGGAVVTTPPAA